MWLTLNGVCSCQAMASERSAIAAQNLVTAVVGLSIAFSADWRLSLVVLACAPVIAVAGSLQMKMFTGQTASAQKSLERVRRWWWHRHPAWRCTHATHGACRLATLSKSLCTVFAPLRRSTSATRCAAGMSSCLRMLHAGAAISSMRVTRRTVCASRYRERLAKPQAEGIKSGHTSGFGFGFSQFIMFAT